MEKREQAINGTNDNLILRRMYTYALPGFNVFMLSFHTKQYSDVIMGVMASQITSLTNVFSTVYSGTDQRKHKNSVSPALVRGIHRWPVNSPHKGPVTWKMFPFNDVIMYSRCLVVLRFVVFRFVVIKCHLLWWTKAEQFSLNIVCHILRPTRHSFHDIMLF